MSPSGTPLHRGGLAAWSIRHPIGISMIALAVIVLGLFSLGRLSVDLLPHIIYPEIRVRIVDPGIPASIMEDRITRQLEEQLAITEDAISIQSQTVEGSSSVDLSFEYGKDIDIALRDTSTRLDRAKRFLPDTINPPVIYKLDPSQLPAIEFVIATSEGDTQRLRDWVDYDFSKHFLNLPGVAAVEVGGGTIREIQVLPDQQRLAAMGLSVEDITNALQRGNIDLPAGRLTMKQRELTGRTAARFGSVEEIARLPIRLSDGNTVPLNELARVNDTHEDERIKVHLNGVPGVKVSIQKQPTANTILVVEAVKQRLQWLKQQKLLPEGIEVKSVADQARYISHSLNNASLAAISGTLLAMAVVYLFLGNLRRTLIIGSAIPIAIMVTFVLMGVGGLTFNIMTLGGLALGVGMLVDNTIVMLENIQRHQSAGESDMEAGEGAAREINSAIVAATSTNLAAVLPFLFVSGLVGLLFRELIFTISAAIFASMIVALTLVPALGVRVHTLKRSPVRKYIDAVIQWLQHRYAGLVAGLLKRPLLQLLLVVALIGALVFSLPTFFPERQEFLPRMDDGLISIDVRTDPGTSLSEMNRTVDAIESLIQSQPEVETVYSVIGGFIFGRSERERSNRSYMRVQLVPSTQRQLSSQAWIRRLQGQINKLQMVGVRVFMRTVGIRGVRVSRGEEALSLRVQGPELNRLATIADEVIRVLQPVAGLNNLQHTAEDVRQELALVIDRERAASLDLDAEDIGLALQRALQGEVVSEFLDGDRSVDIRLRLPRREVDSPHALEQVVIMTDKAGTPLHLSEVARLKLTSSPAIIQRENQRRIVEISASFADDIPVGRIHAEIQQRLQAMTLPEGYIIYDAGELQTLQEGQRMSQMLLALAIFLVFVVMAVQYESLRNPIVILLSIPFAVIGVAGGLYITALPISMPVWLGMIMLAGIVVNNAIVLVEYIEIARQQGAAVREAIIDAARLRLRPILMTTLTTIAGMSPLAMGVGEGGEMLQPLAVALIYGLGMSLLVTLLLIPTMYQLFYSFSANKS